MNFDYQNGENIVYALDRSGHRESYLALFNKMFSLEIVTGRVNIATAIKLIRAKSLVFATLDDHMPSFIFIVFVRSLLNKSSAALFLRSEKCFESGAWYYSYKKVIFSIIKRFRALNILTITPFSSAPNYQKIANLGTYDPQYWDIYNDINQITSSRTTLSDSIKIHSNGRDICCIMGSLISIKGLSFINNTILEYPELTKKISFIFAGRSPADDQDIIEKLKQKDVLVIDRFITDLEMESVYNIADMIWCCYEPSYNQSSGIFGRAIQHRKDVIVRSNSILSNFCENERIQGSIPIPYNNTHELYKYLIDYKSSPKANDLDIFREWEIDFKKNILNSIKL
ncbi:hypothetical protein N9797_01755 [Gammaproteobacteria bacterium]|jgi:hypothetical protein|nr:hypothetical protein [Gammaproteobacteria bacterium]